MLEEFLPIGTVCLLKQASRKVMITGYLVKPSNTDKIYDYVGCLYPHGMLSSNQNLVFNSDDIQQIFFKGYRDGNAEKFLEKLMEKKK